MNATKTHRRPYATAPPGCTAAVSSRKLCQKHGTRAGRRGACGPRSVGLAGISGATALVQQPLRPRRMLKTTAAAAAADVSTEGCTACATPGESVAHSCIRRCTLPAGASSLHSASNRKLHQETSTAAFPATALSCDWGAHDLHQADIPPRLAAQVSAHHCPNDPAASPSTPSPPSAHSPALTLPTPALPHWTSSFLRLEELTHGAEADPNNFLFEESTIPILASTPMPAEDAAVQLHDAAGGTDAIGIVPGAGGMLECVYNCGYTCASTMEDGARSHSSACGHNPINMIDVDAWTKDAV
jgi:hypothetical protein